MMRPISWLLIIGLVAGSTPMVWAEPVQPVVMSPAVQRRLKAVEHELIVDELLDRLEHPTEPERSTVTPVHQQLSKPRPVPRTPARHPPLLPTPSPVEGINQAIAPVKISGEYRLAAGADTDGLEFKEANGDLNERNFRILSGPRTVNTFDPNIYSRLRIHVTTERPQGWNLHSNITIDPWSVVGKTQRIDVVGTGGDRAEIQLKWWSNTGKTINETFLTQKNGDSFATPEIKVVDGHTVVTPITSTFSNTFTVQALDIQETFQPLRELRLDYTSPDGQWRIFPWGLENQAVSSDDPLGLSNHHIYWEPSPWLDAWVPGIDNVGTSPRDVTRGNWSDDLSFFTRDSDLTRLTTLRGTSAVWQPEGERFTWQGAIASPKGLWQDLDSFSSFVGMSRLKVDVEPGLTFGSTYTTRYGYREGHQDAADNVVGVDVSVAPAAGTQLSAEWATSRSVIDQTTAFESDTRGHAWETALQSALPVAGQTTWKLWYAHMDSGFDPGLASYRETRDDQFWSRHLQFRPPLRLLSTRLPLYQPALRWEDIEPFRLGDGIDIGRDAMGTRLTSKLFDERLITVLDLRNVHTVEGKYLETVFRAEQTALLTDRLTGKWLVIREDLPRTVGGIDPFLVNSDNDRPLRNAAITDGLDPSLTTISPGLKYAFGGGWSAYGIWEYTNDTTAATDNFPRGLFNSSSFTTFVDEGRVVRIPEPFVYSQGFFPLPPYAYFNIFRAGLSWAPSPRFESHLSWTRNPFQAAGQIDDNMNQVGLQVGWYPTDRFGIIGKYTFSRSIDLAKMNNGGGADFESHHDLFAQLRWRMTADNELVLEFGEGTVAPPVYIVTASPFGGAEPTLDTVHLVRVYVVGKF